MGQGKGVITVNALVGRSVLSLSSGNRLGSVRDVFVDPLNGVLFGMTVASSDGSISGLLSDQIHSFGNDAVMALSEDALRVEESLFGDKPSTRDLIGAQIITESGNILGQIADVHITTSPPPFVIYQVRDSIFDRLLGRELFIPASVGYALSDDRQRLIVPDDMSELAATSIDGLLEGGVTVRSFSADSKDKNFNDDTVIVAPSDDEVTVVREREDETVIRAVDEDETVVRFRRRTAS